MLVNLRRPTSNRSLVKAGLTWPATSTPSPGRPASQCRDQGAELVDDQRGQTGADRSRFCGRIGEVVGQIEQFLRSTAGRPVQLGQIDP